MGVSRGDEQHPLHVSRAAAARSRAVNLEESHLKPHAPSMYARPEALLFPTPRERLVDAQGRPYFLWDSDMTLAAFEAALQDPDPEVRAWLIGKLMRQAKPDDVFQFVSLATIRAHWTLVERYLGQRRAFWNWLLDGWKAA